MIKSELAAILTERQLSITKLAQQTGIDHQILSQLANNQAQQLNLQQLNMLARTLELELDDLLTLIPDQELLVVLTALNRTTKQFQGQLKFIDHDCHQTAILPLTGCYEQTGLLTTFLINDTFDTTQSADKLRTRLEKLQAANPSPLTEQQTQAAENFPADLIWLQSHDEPTNEADLDRFFQINSLLAAAQYTDLKLVLKPLAMGLIAAFYNHPAEVLGPPTMAQLQWGEATGFRLFNCHLLASPEALAQAGLNRRQTQVQQQRAQPVNYTNLEFVDYFFGAGNDLSN